jgi:hypothetical protein
LEIHILKSISPKLMIPVPSILFYCVDFYVYFIHMFGVMLIPPLYCLDLYCGE